jgi:hypothetical protein
MTDRYQTHRALAVTEPTTVIPGRTYYEAYCLGQASFVYEVVFTSNQVLMDDTIDRPYLQAERYGRSFLNDMGMGPSNHNQHLVFAEQADALAYVDACKADVEECERHRQCMTMLDEFENGFNYDDGDEP